MSPTSAKSSTKGNPKRRPAAEAKRAAEPRSSSEEAPSDHPEAVDVNLVSLEGRLATAPDIRSFDSGARLARVLVTVRSAADRPRTDVIPITVWNPAAQLGEAARGDRVVVEGTIQRRFWTDVDGRKSRVEVVASSVEVTRLGRDR